MKRETLLLSATQMAERAGVPLTWLKAEADAGRIPSLRVRSRRMFLSSAVESALARLATPIEIGTNREAGGQG
jgi:hypothetical protein